MVYDAGVLDCYMSQICMVYDATLFYWCRFPFVWNMMNLVARITPATKVFTKKKIFFSGFNAGKTFPIRGKNTPIALAIKINTKAIILYLKVFALSRSSFSLSQVYSSATKDETTTKWTRIEKENINRLFILILPIVDKSLTKKKNCRN